MRTVTEVSRLTGVSVRTLHHYDAIGLLTPTKVTDAGYRMYDDAALRRLQHILLFRELQFPLKEIKAILDSPNFDLAEAIDRQIALLELQYRHIGELITFAREIQTKGEQAMTFNVFDKGEIEACKAEAKEKWGHTAAYQEYEQKTAAQNACSAARSADALMAIFSRIGTMRQQSPEDEAVQAEIAALQQFITDHMYTCTPEILHGLGEMYVQDERFKQNIDKAGGDGTADFVRQAIAVYCAKSV